ncbi:hypothetical protein F2P56_014387 [Juglans regia]|uniref:Uncharacterized protein n=1 Tax=Juglans regia TaxID=51240 RepID=A0A834CSA1_JUGRE|nr:hypothetical protein F2P56_014387 [Juglans regia]
MAGWWMLAHDGSALDCAKSPRKKLKQNVFWVDLEQALEGSEKASRTCVEGEREPEKLRCEFKYFLRGIRKEICAEDPLPLLPPMFEDGRRVNLLKLFWVMRERGGCDAVSEKSCGFRWPKSPGCWVRIFPRR